MNYYAMIHTVSHLLTEAWDNMQLQGATPVNEQFCEFKYTVRAAFEQVSPNF